MMSSTTNVGEITFRRARWKDAAFLYRLASDPEVRKHSLDQRMPTVRGHVRWMRRMMDPDHRMLIVSIRGERAGVITGTLHRELLEGGRELQWATVGVSLRRFFRGRGHGVRVIAEGSDELALDMGIPRLVAVISVDNEPSTRAFSRAGYRAVAMRKEPIRTGDGALLHIPVIIMEALYRWRS